jgi:hypothetical protein
MMPIGRRKKRSQLMLTNWPGRAVAAMCGASIVRTTVWLLSLLTERTTAS